MGRSDDVILTSGYRIGTFEVENALVEHPAVAESTVVSGQDKIRGKVVKAFAVLSPGYEAGEVTVRKLQGYVKK